MYRCGRERRTGGVSRSKRGAARRTSRGRCTYSHSGVSILKPRASHIGILVVNGEVKASAEMGVILHLVRQHQPGIPCSCTDYADAMRHVRWFFIDRNPSFAFRHRWKGDYVACRVSSMAYCRFGSHLRSHVEADGLLCKAKRIGTMCNGTCNMSFCWGMVTAQEQLHAPGPRRGDSSLRTRRH